MAPRRALGRGLGDVFAETLGSRRTLALTNIEPNPRQPRQGLVEAELEGLAASISRYGVLQPIVVSERADHPGRFYLVAGERRWRAAGMAGLTEVPASIVTVDDRRQLELALVENLQRSDLSPLDRSHAYRVLMDEFGLTQEAVAAALGVSRSAVANALRLLSLDEASLAALREGEITEGHARALLAVTDIRLAQSPAAGDKEPGPLGPRGRAMGAGAVSGITGGNRRSGACGSVRKG